MEKKTYRRAHEQLMEMEGNKYLMMLSHGVVFAVVWILYGEPAGNRKKRIMNFLMRAHTLAQCGTLKIMKVHLASTDTPPHMARLTCETQFSSPIGGLTVALYVVAAVFCRLTSRSVQISLQISGGSGVISPKH
jgi:hypothetical protein